jgi:NADP-dependent 3-hydroxy acid dehydrogenase YdfG
MKKTILITGATSGFGKAIAEKFASENHDLIITGRRSNLLKALQQELQTTYGIIVTTLNFDIRDKEAVKAAVATLKEQPIDILVNNAGLAAGLATIDEGALDDWDCMIDTNLKGLLYITKSVIPLLKKSTCPHIFNIGSTAAKMSYKNGNVYCATKHAVDALSQAMRIDLLPFSIKVTAIHPGMAETEFSLVRFKGDATKAKQVYEDIMPLQAADIAHIVSYSAALPAHVCINDLTVTCTNQANAVYTLRNKELQK